MTLNAKYFIETNFIANIEFENVLKLFEYCYYQIKKKESFNGNEEENLIANILVKAYLRKNKRKFNIGHLLFEVQSGEISIDFKTIGYIDIKISNIGNKDLTDEDEYYCFECKRLNGYSSYNKKYVLEGIKRFVIGKYSSEMSLAGMIGFVQRGDLNIIINEINNKLKKYPSTKTAKYLKKCKIGNINYLYKSNHGRGYSLPNIDIYHLMYDLNLTI